MALLLRQTVNGLLLLLLCCNFNAVANETLWPTTLELTSNSGYLQGRNILYFESSDFQIPQHEKDLPEYLRSLPQLVKPQMAKGQLVAAIRILNTTQQQRWFINPYSPVVESVAVYFLNDDHVQQGISGLHHSGEVYLQQGNFVDIPTGVTGTLLLVFDSDFYLAPVKVNLIAEDHIEEQLQSRSMLMLLALGMLIALSIYNLFLYVASREKAYLYFTLCSAVLAFAWANIIGVFKLFFTVLPDSLLLPPFLISAGFSILLTRQFLSLKSISSKLDNVLILFFWSCLLLVPITAFAPHSGIYVVYTAISLVIGTSIGAGVIAWKRRYKPARFFIFAYCAFALQSLLWTLAFLLPDAGTSVSIIFIGLMSSTTGCILLSLSLAAKVSLITDENQRLANSLEQKVYERTEALAEANVALEHLISELQEASSAKSHFLANMSHEIRTPLTAIIGYADGILEGDISREEQERVLRVISENGNHLLHIISDILDISKIEADKLEYEMLACSVVEILAQVESVMAKRARDKGLVFNLNYHFPIPSEITTDPYRFRQILLNLTNNAIKFTEQGFIAIDVHYQNEQLTISVEDTGIGMSREKISAIFDPFEQGDISVTRQFGGTGLGLSISRRLAIGLGGDISVNSEPGKGSCFKLQVAAAPTSESSMLECIEQLSLNAPAGNEVEQPVPDFSGSKVLLVDDHPNNRDLIRIILKRMNVTVTEAEDGDIALQKVFEQEYDLVLMDIQMPRMKGDEATETMRSNGYKGPVIALTANNMKHEIESYMSKGFDGHLAKPIDRHDFISTLSKYLRCNGSTDGLFSNDEMLGLVRDYYADLKLQIVEFEQYWAQQELHNAEELAHRIKGAAGSFGFDFIGQKFANIEQLLKIRDLDKAQTLIPETLNSATLICDLPGIDVPSGVVRNDMDVALLLSDLQHFCNRLPEDMQQIWSSLARGEHNIAKLYLKRIAPKAQKLGWLGLAHKTTDLLEQISQNQLDESQLKTLETEFTADIDKLTTLLANNTI